MKRFLTLAMLVLMTAALAGCGAPAATTSPASNETSASAGPPLAAPYAPISLSGAHEASASAAIPNALKTVADAAKTSKKAPPDFSNATATLVAYVVQATVADQAILFEVRADGRAYELFHYPSPPAPQHLLWQPASNSAGAVVVDPRSSAERGAASGVASIIKISKPNATAEVKMYGYVFYWIKGDGTPVLVAGGQPFSLTIDPKGHAASWTL